MALSAHMDTVWETSKDHEIFYDRHKNVMVSLRGGGFDDKAGIFMILKILEEGFRPHVVFCADEESGSLGADKLVETFPTCPFGDCRFIVMLDRRNFVDCVFYDCDNEEFTAYIEKFGFKEAWGTFTDICTLCPAWEMAGVNLSIGYMNEHTAYETLHVGAMYNTLNKVKMILSQPDEDIKYFKYIRSAVAYGRWWHSYYNDDEPQNYDDKCCICGKQLDKNKTYLYTNAMRLDGTTISTFCEDCGPKYVDYCEVCGEAFEIDPKMPDMMICPKCYDFYVNGDYPDEFDRDYKYDY